MILLFLACAEPGTVTLINGRGDEPIDEVALRVVDGEGKRCPSPVPPTGGGGQTVIPANCTGRSWTIEVESAGWWVAEPPAAADGARVRAWPVLPAGGVGRLAAGIVEPWLTNTAVDEVALPGGGAVRYPIEVPLVLPILGPDAVLVLDAPGLSVVALVPGAARTFGSPTLPLHFGPWFYLGARVGPEGAPEPVEVSEAGFETVTGAARTLRYVPAAALEPGRYAVLTESRTRAVLFEVKR